MDELFKIYKVNAWIEDDKIKCMSQACILQGEKCPRFMKCRHELITMESRENVIFGVHMLFQQNKKLVEALDDARKQMCLKCAISAYCSNDCEEIKQLEKIAKEAQHESQREKTPGQI